MPVFDVDFSVVVVVLVSDDVDPGEVLGLVVVVSVLLELLGGVVVVELPLGLVVVVVELELGGAPGLVVVVVVDVVLLVSRPSVRLRSEHAPSATVANVAAMATPIVCIFSCFIISPVGRLEIFVRD